MRYAIVGYKTTIAERFAATVKEREPDAVIIPCTTHDVPFDADYYLFCSGWLAGEDMQGITDGQAADTFRINFTDPVRAVDTILEMNPKAKIVIIGSLSGIKGSYDVTYAAAKAGVHLYVKTKKLVHPGQHLVCVAPGIIQDSGMTERRNDYEACMARGRDRRIGRWLMAQEVADVVHVVINQPAFCNLVVPMSGGD